MTATNHVMTGAFIAVAVQRPLLAIPLAFASHFFIDLLPHYGYGDIAFEHRDRQKYFVLKQAIDAYAALALGLSVPFLLKNHQSPAVTAWCMFAAYFPDMIWGIQFALAHRRGHYKERGWFSRFHKWIQWCERPWGMYVEVMWLAITILAIVVVTS
jgi:hypothetical protein